MSIVQWNPFREMDDLLARVMRGSGNFPTLSTEAGAVAAWSPSVDISENPKEYRVRAELPGVDKDAVKVTAQHGVLTLSGERKFEKEDKDEKHHRVERAYGSFTRSFSIPDDVAEDAIVAECKEGVLTIRLPKLENRKTTPTQIPVK